MAAFRFIAIGCTHAPITHKGYWDWVLTLIEEFKPAVFVHLGDMYEGLAGTRHARDPRHDWSLFDEHRAVAAQLNSINQFSFLTRRVWMAGNHDDNAFGIHADRIPKDLRDVASYRNNRDVSEALGGWIVRDDYRHGARWYLGQVSFGHGCPVTDASAKDEAYLYGVPYGLDIRAHTHRPEQVTQARERKAPLPYWTANVGTGADWDKMHYMDRQSKALWGRGAVIGEVKCTGEGREVRATRNWDAELLVHSWALHARDILAPSTVAQSRLRA